MKCDPTIPHVMGSRSAYNVGCRGDDCMAISARTARSRSEIERGLDQTFSMAEFAKIRGYDPSTRQWL